jgi:hypothetical protein
VLPESIDASELEGMLKPPARLVIVEDMNRAIRKRGRPAMIGLDTTAR